MNNIYLILEVDRFLGQIKTEWLILLCIFLYFLYDILKLYKKHKNEKMMFYGILAWVTVIIALFFFLFNKVVAGIIIASIGIVPNYYYQIYKLENKETTVLKIVLPILLSILVVFYAVLKN